MKIFRRSDFLSLKKIKKDWKDRLLAGVIMGILSLLFYLFFWAGIMNLLPFNIYGILLSSLIGFILGFIFKEVDLPIP